MIMYDKSRNGLPAGWDDGHSHCHPKDLRYESQTEGLGLSYMRKHGKGLRLERLIGALYITKAGTRRLLGADVYGRTHGACHQSTMFLRGRFQSLCNFCVIPDEVRPMRDEDADDVCMLYVRLVTRRI
jgi:hypothetical protein